MRNNNDQQQCNVGTLLCLTAIGVITGTGLGLLIAIATIPNCGGGTLDCGARQSPAKAPIVAGFVSGTASALISYGLFVLYKHCAARREEEARRLLNDGPNPTIATTEEVAAIP